MPCRPTCRLKFNAGSGRQSRSRPNPQKRRMFLISKRVCPNRGHARRLVHHAKTALPLFPVEAPRGKFVSFPTPAPVSRDELPPLCGIRVPGPRSFTRCASFAVAGMPALTDQFFFVLFSAGKLFSPKKRLLIPHSDHSSCFRFCLRMA